MTSVNPIGSSGLSTINGDVTATQFVNASNVDTNFQTLRAKVDALIVALKPTIRNDNQLSDAIVRLRCLSSEVITLIADGANSWQIKVAVQAASVGNLALSGEQTFDSFTTNLSRVLVKDQTDPTQNGLYDTNPGAWTRCTDADTGDEMRACAVAVTGGSANKGTAWVLTLGNQVPVLGVTPLIFAQFGGGGVSGNDNNNYVDVTALPYSLVAGTVSDGVATANLAGFNAALAAASGLGKSLYVPIGTYRLHIASGDTGITIPSNIKIFGFGMELSVLEFSTAGQFTYHVKLRDAENVVWEDIGIRNRSSAVQCLVYDWGGTGRNIHHTRVMFDGNGPGATRPENILRVENDGTYEFVRFNDCWWTDFRFGVSSNNAFAGLCTDWQWSNCTFTDCNADGIELNRFSGSGSGVWDKCLIDGCYFDTVNGTAGVSGLAIGFSGVRNSQITNCFAQDVNVNAFIHVEDGSYNIAMLGNIAINVFKGYEVYPTCTNMRMIGNMAYGQLASGANPVPGLYMIFDPNGSAFDVTMLDNHIENFVLGIYVGENGETYDVRNNKIIGCTNGIEFRKRCLTVRDNIIVNCTNALNGTADGSRLGKNILIDNTNVVRAGASPFLAAGIEMHASTVSLTSAVLGYWDLFKLPTYMCGVVDVQLWEHSNPALVRSSHLTVTYKGAVWTIVLTAFDLNGVMTGVDSMLTHGAYAAIPATVTDGSGADCYGHFDFNGYIRFP
jgi:hypothetical protein